MFFSDSRFRKNVHAAHDAENIFDSSVISDAEFDSIRYSLSIYHGSTPWQIAASGGLSLASNICNELSRLTVSELSLSFSDNRAGSILKSVFAPFLSDIRSVTELACASGGVMLKPSFDGSLSVQTFLPGEFVPLASGPDRTVTSCAFISRLRYNDRFYTKVESHIPSSDGYTVTNRAFVSDTPASFGRSCPLSDVPAWSCISPSVSISNLKSPLFAYFSIPAANPDFPLSPLGVPVFRRAENLIRQADIQFSRLLWEFEGGELAVDCSEDAFRIGKDGKPQLPLGKERLYRTNTLDACNSTGDLFQTYAPALRDKSLINGLNRIIMFVEDASGIARGTFSDPSSVAKTATEVIAMRQRTQSTVASIRKSLESAVLRLADACSAFISLYDLAYSSPSVSVTFGDGFFSDSDSLRNAEREDFKCGIISADLFKSHWYNS